MQKNIFKPQKWPLEQRKEKIGRAKGLLLFKKEAPLKKEAVAQILYSNTAHEIIFSRTTTLKGLWFAGVIK